MGITCSGPFGVLISLGIENVVSNLQMVANLYNYWSIATVLVLAVSAGHRDAKFIGILMALWGGFCMFAGWLRYPDQGAGFGVLIVCAMLSIMIYMVETRHERFGIAGPGNMIIKIFTFLIILQCVVVFINASSIFPANTPNIAATNNQYATIDLAGQMGNINSAGGLTAAIVDIATITLQMAASALLLFLKCIISIAVFSVVLAQIFPWIPAAGAQGVAFLVILQFAIWIMYLLFAVQIFYRPGPDAGW